MKRRKKVRKVEMQNNKNKRTRVRISRRAPKKD
jgi:hypothetical protein